MLQGDIFIQQKQLALAQESYQKVYQQFPQSNFARLAHQKLGQLFQGSQDFAQAIQEYQMALGSTSGELNAQIEFAIAQCWQAQGNQQKALEGYLKVCYLYPQSTTWLPQAQLKCAQIFEQRNLWQKAKTIYEQLAQGDGPEAEFARQRLQQ